MAGEDIGRAEIEVHADTTPFPGEAKRGVEAGLRDVDPSLKKAGEDWGDTLGQTFGERLKSKVPGIVDKFLNEVHKQHLHETVELDVDTDINKDSVRTFVRNVAGKLEREVSSSGGGGGPFGAVGQAIMDAIGAGFNVSGKSPLVYALIPVFGAIAALVTAAIEAVYGLGAALLTIPNLLVAIGLQAGVLYLIFQNIGGVISKVLAAQNAKELAEALKGVNLYIQNFALEILYIRDAFKALSDYLAIAFLKNLGNTLLDIFDFNRYTLFTGLYTLAQDLGTWFNTVGQAFKSPEFAKYLLDLFKVTDEFIKTNGPVLSRFLTQMFKFFDSLMGATGDIGGLFNEFLTTVGNWLEELSKSKDFQDFLKEMPGILRESGKLIVSLAELFGSLFSGVDKAGGKDFIDNLIYLVNVLTAFLQSDIGIKGLQFLMIIILVLTAAFVDMLIAVLAVFGAIQKAGDWLSETAWPAIQDFFSKLKKAFVDGFSPTALLNLLAKFTEPFEALVAKLYNIGINVVKAFVSGMLHQKNSAVTTAADVMSAVGGAFPSSPAKYGPFSGKGAPFDRGMSTMEDFTKGLMTASDQSVTNTNSAMSNVNFGPGAVIANFYGQNPTPQQAQTLGTALGGGINDQLAARNARLAVRTM